MLTGVEVEKILLDYTDKLHEGVTEDDILEYWNMIVALAETCIALWDMQEGLVKVRDELQEKLKVAMDGLTLREQENETLFKSLTVETNRVNSAMARAIAVEEALAKVLLAIATYCEYRCEGETAVQYCLLDGKHTGDLCALWLYRLGKYPGELMAKRKEQGDGKV